MLPTRDPTREPADTGEQAKRHIWNISRERADRNTGPKNMSRGNSFCEGALTGRTGVQGQPKAYRQTAIHLTPSEYAKTNRPGMLPVGNFPHLEQHASGMPIIQGQTFPETKIEWMAGRGGNYTMLRNPALSHSVAAVIGMRQTSTAEALLGLDIVPNLPNIDPVTQYFRISASGDLLT